MDRLEKLRELEAMLKANLQTSDVRSLAGIAKQYRETIKEIEEIEGGENDGDEIAQLLGERDADGKAGAVRPDRS